MANTGMFHHIGTFFFFAATVLLVITCISSPVLNNLAILKVDVFYSRTGYEHVSFGAFGWCAYGGPYANACSPQRLSYTPARVMGVIDGRSWSFDASDATQRLTQSLVLHPVACALNFLAFLLVLSPVASVVRSLVASVVAALAFLVTVVAMAINFALFQIVKANITNDGSGSHPYYGAAAWTATAAAVCSLFGFIVVFLVCCSARGHRGGASNDETAPAPAAKKDGGEKQKRKRWF